MKNQQLLKGIKCRQIIVITTRTSRVEVVCFEIYTIKAMTVWILPAPFRNHSPPDGISSLDWVKASSWAGPMVLVIGGSFHLGTFFSGKNPLPNQFGNFLTLPESESSQGSRQSKTHHKQIVARFALKDPKPWVPSSWTHSEPRTTTVEPWREVVVPLVLAQGEISK